MAVWMSVLGRLCRQALENGGQPLLLSTLEDEVNTLWLAEGALEEALALVSPTWSFTGPCAVSLAHPLRQFLAAWDALQQNLRGVSLKMLTRHVYDEDALVVFAAGHLRRLTKEHAPNFDRNVDRVAKNFISHMDRTKDR